MTAIHEVTSSHYRQIEQVQRPRRSVPGAINQSRSRQATFPIQSIILQASKQTHAFRTPTKHDPTPPSRRKSPTPYHPHNHRLPTPDFPPPSRRQNTPPPIRRHPLPDPNPQIPSPQPPCPLPLPNTNHRPRRKQQRLPRLQPQNRIKNLLETTVRARTERRRAREVGFQRVEPFRGGEAVDEGHGGQVEELRGDGGFLGCDDDAGAEVALLADGGEEGFGEGGGGGGGGHELGGGAVGC